MRSKFFNRFNFILLISILVSAFSFTQAAGQSDYPPGYYDIIAVALVIIVMIAFLGLIYFESRKDRELKQGESLWDKVKYMLTRSTPIEKEADILLEHEYDGIRELDNRIPPWFNGLFYFTILFGIYYLLNYHVFHTGKLQYEEYEEEMKLAAMQKAELIESGAMINEETVTMLTDAASLSAGKEIFKKNCVACHLDDGGGLVGPNLTDEYWIHGGGIKNVFKTIKYGVPAKGMIRWETQLSPRQIQEVASYVLSLQGTTPANPKAPEGEKWEEPAADNSGSSSM